MYIVRVTPLAALPNTVPQVLDYFWNTTLLQGAVVNVLIGPRSVLAIVLESLPIEHAKLALKKAGFGLKKITSVVTDIPQATGQQLAMIRWMARQYHTPLGLCAKTVLPSFIGKRGRILTLPVGEIKKGTPKTRITLTQPDTAIEEICKRVKTTKGQILVLVPEVSLTHLLAKQLPDTQTVLIHSDLGTKAYATAYRDVLNGTARVIIGTRLSLFLPFNNLEQIIVEDPLHEAYKSDMAPRYNAPDVARQLAELHGAAITYLSPALSVVNHYLIKKEILELKNKKAYWPNVVHVDMVAERQRDNPSIISKTVQEALMDAYDERTSMLIVSPRRAYATAVVCSHCHKPVSCKNCEIPMRLHRTSEDMLVCYHCTAFLQVPKQCPSCKAGKLRSAGLAGSQKIAEAVDICLDRHGLSKIRPPILDSDLVRTDADESRVFETFDGMERPVLVATHMILSHRYIRTFDRIAIIQSDALSYNPDFRTQERLAYQLEKLSDFKPATLYIQSWNRSGILAHAKNRSWETFFEQELTDRKALGWPPFSRLVKLSYAHHERSAADRAARTAADKLQRTAAHMALGKAISILGPTPALVEKAQGRWTQHIILKSTLSAQRLSEFLDHVPQGWLVDIDPRSIT